MDEGIRQQLTLAIDNDMQLIAILAGLISALRERGHLTPPAIDHILAGANRLPHDRPPLVVADIRFRLEFDR
ncbi:MAG: hypothetical protein V3U99_08665 [Alphaproteobacteria bacterium]